MVLLNEAAIAPQRQPRRQGSGAAIQRVTATAYTVPTDAPESDGTFAWDSTTIVVVEIEAGGQTGIGYTYASPAAAHLVIGALAPRLADLNPIDVPTVARRLSDALRNAGRPGIGATAISAVDNCMWDLKAKLLGVSLLDLLGAAREAVPAYGSGGFTSYDDSQLTHQLSGWVEQGFAMVKMKIGRQPELDQHRVAVAREAIGAHADLFVDANGALDRKQALATAGWLAEYGVTWFEEPVTSDDIHGLRLLRDRMPASIEVAAGEYGWTAVDFHRLVEGGAVDVLQADATRCLGISGFLVAAALCRANSLPLSAHCAPALHSTLGCAVPAARHIEWFHDHVRVEHMLFDGAPAAVDGQVIPDRTRPGLGLELRRPDAEQFLTWHGEWRP